MKKTFSILIGFVASSLTMMAFEFTNSLLFPFPADLDKQSLEQIRAFAAQMPLTALILVACGWILGSTVGGYVSTKLSKTKSSATALTLGGVLTLFAGLNAWMIQNPLWFHLGGLPVFIIFSYLGFKLATHEKIFS